MSDVIAFGRQLTLVDALGTNLRSLNSISNFPSSRVGIIPDGRGRHIVIGAAWSDGFTVTMGYHRGGISFQRSCLPPTIRTLKDYHHVPTSRNELRVLILILRPQVLA
ncbi:hypothetical protein E4U39_002301 [Claviceps sp. Clav50 group G5]|nr:hypothetical protein E4U39_002301 [Claviceps sp. Clav50 group G5]